MDKVGWNLPVILNIVSLQYNEYTQHIVINIQRHTRNIHQPADDVILTVSDMSAQLSECVWLLS